MQILKNGRGKRSVIQIFENNRDKSKKTSDDINTLHKRIEYLNIIQTNQVLD